ncbi:MAG: flagellar basal body L-ring protein FlgH [Phycisphaeraceae bacterium]
MKRTSIGLIVAGVVGAGTSAAWGQSSSLFLPQSETRSTPSTTDDRGAESQLSPQIAAVSLSAVTLPEPRKFQLQDLVTIIIRESTEADSDSTLDTKKSTNVSGEIKAFPSLSLWDLAGGNLSNPPKVDLNFKNDFKGEGDYKRKDTFTSRITARIIDIKPNGTLVLEARKYIKSDKETLDMVLTGVCRKEDIGVDNTVLSTQLYDLRVNKEHKGEVKNAAKKGIFTKVFELLFNF